MHDDQPREIDSDATPDERTWAAAAHLIGFCGYVIPFGGIAGPLVIWLSKRDESSFIEENAREALNFQITTAIVLLLAGLLVLSCFGLVVGLPLLLIVPVLEAVAMGIAAVKAYDGESFRYPLTLRLV